MTFSALAYTRTLATFIRWRLGWPITIHLKKFADGYTGLIARRKSDGTLVLDAADAGPTVEDVTGEWDCVYQLYVPPSFATQVLKLFLRGELKRVSDARAWCKAHGVPTKFETW
jgi:hypothetical protein